MKSPLPDLCAGIMPPVDYWSLRLTESEEQTVQVRQRVLEPTLKRLRSGAFITVYEGEGAGYGATCDLSREGLRTAALEAREWARASAPRSLFAAQNLPRVVRRGIYTAAHPWRGNVFGELIAALMEAARKIKCHERIVDWQAGVRLRHTRTVLCTSLGGRIEQEWTDLTPELVAVASNGIDTQRRSFGADCGRQGGLEQLEKLGFHSLPARIAEEALLLLEAPKCPAGRMDLLLLPGQMILQLHESIGHPIELDRILGDERNYAGGSFVTLDMFGYYRYGSQLLNVTFDPACPGQFASYAFDDEGGGAERQYLIRAGILERPLGGHASQARAGIAGVACARAEHWHRPPIDRMANLNIEPGMSPIEALVGGIEHGIMMDTNRSWSIDDQRNKFQFGCECGWVIKDGEVKSLVKNPNYRGTSATFWRNLGAVGDASTWRMMGLSTCGKGEPNQTIHVGHAAPACVFRDVDVFSNA
ncbi:MAG: TldD/PmbA family protein [Gammaproteobacteria bacterium]